MSLVTIPTASYVRSNGKNLLLPELLPLLSDFNQQAKLWRFYCTCFDVGCSNYKLEDFIGKNLSQKDKYLLWVKDWKVHYADVSNLIRAYRKAKDFRWFSANEQKPYRDKLTAHILTKNPKAAVDKGYVLWETHVSIVNDRIDSLRRSAQHLLNARMTAKLASQALVERQRRSEKTHVNKIVATYYDKKKTGDGLVLTPVD